MKSIVTKIQEDTYLQKLLKWLKGELTVPITNCLNKRIPLSPFRDELKTAGIIPVYKSKRRMIDQFQKYLKRSFIHS